MTSNGLPTTPYAAVEGRVVFHVAPRRTKTWLEGNCIERDVKGADFYPEHEEDKRFVNLRLGVYSLVYPTLVDIDFDFEDDESPVLFLFKQWWAKRNKLNAVKLFEAALSELPDLAWNLLSEAELGTQQIIPSEQKPGPMLSEEEKEELADPKAD